MMGTPMVHKWMKLLFAFSILVLAHCPSTGVNVPSLQFLNRRIEWYEALAERNKDTDVQLNLRLDPWSIYALDENIVFLFGNLGVGAGWQQSILLRSSDGGVHWREVMTPEPASDVVQVTFVGGGHGWALVLRTVETPGPGGHLYHTADYGQTWQMQANIPSLGSISYPVYIGFFDTQRGQISIETWDATGWGCCTLSSSDGGMTWRETGNCYLDGRDLGLTRRMTVSTRDGCQWRFEVQEGPQITLSRRLPSEYDFNTVGRIPMSVEYLGEQGIVP